MRLDEIRAKYAKGFFMGVKTRHLEDKMLSVLRQKKMTNAFDEWNWITGQMLQAMVGAGIPVEDMPGLCLSQIDTHTQYDGYNKQKTDRFIRAHPLYRSLSLGLPVTTTISNNIAVPPCLLTPAQQRGTFTKGIDVINHFFAHTEAVLPMDVPEDIREAAHNYYRLGYTPLPKHPEHKHPGVYYASHGIFYRNNRFPEAQLDTWAFEHGICLLGDSGHCYLDIDNHPGKDNGTMWLDDHLMRLIHSRHYERSKSGGYHVFGLGDLSTIPSTEGIEVRGNSALIVAAPTEGYRVNKYI